MPKNRGGKLAGGPRYVIGCNAWAAVTVELPEKFEDIETAGNKEAISADLTREVEKSGRRRTNVRERRLIIISYSTLATMVKKAKN